MEGTDVSVYVDPNILHDHTYYGNGCEVQWDVGSPTACDKRTAVTYDNETLSMGTYYSYQAASSGSGTSVSTDGAKVPDSFCPLGWQLPYGGTVGDYYDKSKSWRYLFNTYGLVASTNPYGNSVRSYPFSYIGSGNYRISSNGYLYSLSKDGDYNSAIVKSSSNAYQFDVGGTLFHVNRQTSMGFNQANRCV